MEVDNKLIFSPKEAFSKRFPPFFFSISIDGYETTNYDTACCFFGKENKPIVFYKIIIMRGKYSYYVHRRFSEFYQLQQDLLELNMNITTDNKNLFTLQRTYCDVSGNKTFLDERKRVLNTFLTNILIFFNAHISNIIYIKRFLMLI